MTDRLDGLSMDIEAENKARLQTVFPECFTEGKLDIDKLLSLCGEYITDDFEKYEFKWKGKSDCLRMAQRRSTATLRPCPSESVNFDTTQNLYIEGDNLEVLKLLQKSYFRKVKMIYIDPPYNTGNDFVYEDDFADPMRRYVEVTQQTTKSNPETMGRYHTNWLNMMYPRLRLASNLLRDDGVIFISIDDNEVVNLRRLCNEVFGEENFVAQIVWQSRQSIQNDTDISINHEYIVAYAKKRRIENRRLKESNYEVWHKKEDFVCYPLPLDISAFANPDNDPRGLWKAAPFDAPNVRPNLTYEIINPNTGEKYMPPTGRHWRTEEKRYLEWLADNRIVFGKTGVSRPQLKVFYEEKKEFGSVENTWFDGERFGTATKGTKELQNVFDGISYFDTPKPIQLILKLIKLSGASNNDIILDFFSGSATTAHAVMQLNAEDGGNRRFIMVQLPEVCGEKSEAFKAGYSNICEIGKERIRRAGARLSLECGIRSEELNENNSTLHTPNSTLDTGFKVFKLDTSNMKLWDDAPIPDGNVATLFERIDGHIDGLKPNRSDADLIYEILLKMGYPLTCPLTAFRLSVECEVWGVVGER